ncbi:MAG: L-carnitine dehydratase/bile acid-inducible protein F [uncultured Thermomicrobiales bacterium]|uniref:L-carnitine dehydratase/bile acid-inducible protein F n=1 Tax=uncultured Thermomicrobiales bacterium TaxID=1645740 RepID=A0A6J4VHC2_9BACT|nr:MAG: L-carnitine dehydratase/bile acid-inducible protein F [uncultured Thermomicrobiales bacterium]
MLPRPLAGVRVLDLTRVLAGPFATMLLADAGADVVKVEPPGGDDTRRWGPPWAGGESAYFLSTNRNKRGICLDLSRPAGREILLRLADEADVLIENFKVGTMERWGLGYEETLRPRNPRLVYASITGYGRTGPDAHLPGYDVIVEALGGLMSITGEPDGGPVKVGVAIVDIVTGCLAAYGVAAALARRAETGSGGRVDLALLDSCLAALANQAGNYLIGGVVPARMGNAHPSIVPYQTFPTADGTLMVGVGNDRQFGRLCAVIDQPALAADPRFRTNPDRVRHRDALVAALTAAFQTRSAAEWSDRCGEADIPAAPVRDLAAAFSTPQVAARGLISEIAHPTAGMVRMVTSPVRFDAEAPCPYRHPPRLGEHAQDILAEAGFSAEQIATWQADGTVGPGPQR